MQSEKFADVLTFEFESFESGPLYPVAVPEILCSLFARRIPTAATPRPPLTPPLAAVGLVPTSIPLRMLFSNASLL